MSDSNPQQEKEKYASPKVTVISLRPEEAVLGHCKNATTLSGPGTGGATCSFGTSCPTIGS